MLHHVCRQIGEQLRRLHNCAADHSAEEESELALTSRAARHAKRAKSELACASPAEIPATVAQIWAATSVVLAGTHQLPASPNVRADAVTSWKVFAMIRITNCSQFGATKF